MDGSQIEGLYQAGQLETIRDYCLADVAQTALLFLRFRLLQGALTRAEYVEAARALTESLAEHPRLDSLTPRDRRQPTAARGLMGFKPRPWAAYNELLAPYAEATDAKTGDLGPSPLRFTNPREPTVGDLDDRDRRLIAAAGTNYDGMTHPADVRLSTHERDHEWSFAGLIELWDVERDGELAYHAAFYRGDSGSFFAAGTTDTVAHVIQTFIQCDDPVLARQLKAALQLARRERGGKKRLLHNMC